MGLIHGDAAEAALPEMPGALQPGMNVAGVAAVDRGQDPAQGVRRGRDQDQVHVVGHEDPGPDLDAGRRGVLGQEVAIELIVLLAEEGLSASIATLGHMMGKAGEHGASEASRAPTLGGATAARQLCALSP